MWRWPDGLMPRVLLRCRAHRNLARGSAQSFVATAVYRDRANPNFAVPISGTGRCSFAYQRILRTNR